MATTSFDKDFKVTNIINIKKFKAAAINPKIPIIKKSRDYEADRQRGICLLTQQLEKQQN